MLISPPERGDGIGLNSDTLPTIEDWNQRPVLRSCAISWRVMVLGWGSGAYPGRCHCCVITHCRCRHQHAPSSLSSPCTVIIAMLLLSWCAVLVIALLCTTLSCHCTSSVITVACLPLSLWAVTITPSCAFAIVVVHCCCGAAVGCLHFQWCTVWVLRGTSAWCLCVMPGPLARLST